MSKNDTVGINNYEELIDKVEKAKKSGVDLSIEEDLAIGIMNLISLEEHFFFTGSKTGKDEYYGMLNDVREMRKTLMKRMLERTEGESWCISKHLLATTMRLFEVGTKLNSKEDKTSKAQAKETFQMAFKTFNIFFALRLKIIKLPEAVNMMKIEKPMTFDDILKGMTDCCKE